MSIKIEKMNKNMNSINKVCIHYEVSHHNYIKVTLLHITNIPLVMITRAVTMEHLHSITGCLGQCSL